MYANEKESDDFLVVFFLENHSVCIQLEGIMPEIGIWDVLDTFGGCSGIAEFVFVSDFFAPFPIVYQERSVGIFIDHIDGTRQFDFFAINHPFGSVGFQFGEIFQKLLEKLVFDTGVRHRHLVIIMLDIGVHFGSCVGGLVAVFVPGLFDLFVGHSVVFVGIGIVPFLALFHILDDLVGVEMCEM